MTGQDDAKPTRRRWHRSTWVFVAIGALVILLLNLLPRDVLDIDWDGSYDDFGDWKMGPHLGSFTSHFDHGWPTGYLRRNTIVVRYNPLGHGTLSEESNPWQFWTGVERFNMAWLGMNVFLAGGVLAILGITCERRRRRRSNVWQFTIRDLAMLVLILSVGLSAVMAQWSGHERDVRIVEGEQLVPDAGGDDYVDRIVEQPIWYRSRLPGMASLLGDRLDRVAYISLTGPELHHAAGLTSLRSLQVREKSSIRQLQQLEACPQLEGLIITSEIVDDSTVVIINGDPILHLQLPKLPKLRALSLYEANFTVAGLEHLTALESVCLSGNRIDDQIMPAFARMTHLQQLGLDDTEVTSDGIRHLSQLKELQWLSVAVTAIDDEAVQWLVPLKSLRFLDIRATQITEVEQLRRALPDCEIVGPW